VRFRDARADRRDSREIPMPSAISQCARRGGPTTAADAISDRDGAPVDTSSAPDAPPVELGGRTRR
jgi:hypothetical protein